MTYRVEITDNNQLMICDDGDVICLSEPNCIIDEHLSKKFNVMCEALNQRANMNVKIICTDNYDRDHIADTLICSNVKPHYAMTIVEALNTKFGGEHSSDYFKHIPVDQKLKILEP